MARQMFIWSKATMQDTNFATVRSGRAGRGKEGGNGRGMRLGQAVWSYAQASKVMCSCCARLGDASLISANNTMVWA